MRCGVFFGAVLACAVVGSAGALPIWQPPVDRANAKTSDAAAALFSTSSLESTTFTLDWNAPFSSDQFTPNDHPVSLENMGRSSINAPSVLGNNLLTSLNVAYAPEVNGRLESDPVQAQGRRVNANAVHAGQPGPWTVTTKNWFGDEADAFTTETVTVTPVPAPAALAVLGLAALAGSSRRRAL